MDKTKGTQFYNKCKITIVVNTSLEQTEFGGMNFAGLLDNSYLHTQVYPLILEKIRNIIIDNMARPKEVLVIIDENGEAVEQAFDDTETISIYEMMRETLIYLTNINC
jgi:exportin-1